MASTADSKSSSSKVPLQVGPPIARIFLGIIFFVFGLNGFLHFIPQPKDAMPGAAGALMGGMMQTHYMMPLIFGTQFIVGVLLLSNKFVPLALALIAPVIVNIVGFHLFLQPMGLPPGAVAAALEIYLAWSYRSYFLPMLQPSAKPV